MKTAAHNVEFRTENGDTHFYVYAVTFNNYLSAVFETREAAFEHARVEAHAYADCNGQVSESFDNNKVRIRFPQSTTIEVRRFQVRKV